MFTRIMSRYNPYNNEVEDIYFWVSSSGLKSSSVFSNICNVSYGRIWVVDCEASTWLTAIKASTFKIARVKWRFVGSSRSGHMHNERKYEASWNFYSFERKRKIGLNQQHHLMGSTGDGRCGLTLLSEHGNQLKELGILQFKRGRRPHVNNSSSISTSLNILCISKLKSNIPLFIVKVEDPQIELIKKSILLS